MATLFKVEFVHHSNFYYFSDETIHKLNQVGGIPLKLFEHYVKEVCSNKDLAQDEDLISHYANRIQRSLAQDTSTEENVDLN